MKENNQKRIILSIMVIAVLIAVLAAGTYAYFAATISGDDTSTSIQITASSDGTVIEFTGGEEVNLEGIYPRTAPWLTKDITIHTTGTSGAVSKPMYSFNIVVTENDFDLDDIQYTFTNKVHTGVDSDYTETTSKTNLATKYDIAHGIVDVSSEVTVTYTLNVYFVNNENKNQNTGEDRSVKFHITYGWGAPVELTRSVDGVETDTIVPENTVITLDRPTKEGYTFKGWTAEGATVSGNYLLVGSEAIKITANFKAPAPAPVNFKTDSWETIAEAVANGNTSLYNVGNAKEVEITGLTNEEKGSNGLYTVRIANMNTSGSCGVEGFSQSACGFVVEFVDIIETRAMNSSDTNKGGWPGSEMYKYLNGTYDSSTDTWDRNNTLYSNLPSDLQEVIADTRVVSGHGSSDPENFTSTDKLYLLSPKEVSNYTNTYDTTGGDEYTIQLEYYKNLNVNYSSNKSYAIKEYNGTYTRWWLRAAPSDNRQYFFLVENNRAYGLHPSYYASYTYGVAPAFRIG